MYACLFASSYTLNHCNQAKISFETYITLLIIKLDVKYRMAQNFGRVKLGWINGFDKKNFGGKFTIAWTFKI